MQDSRYEHASLQAGKQTPSKHRQYAQHNSRQKANFHKAPFCHRRRTNHEQALVLWRCPQLTDRFSRITSSMENLVGNYQQQKPQNSQRMNPIPQSGKPPQIPSHHKGTAGRNNGPPQHFLALLCHFFQRFGLLQQSGIVRKFSPCKLSFSLKTSLPPQLHKISSS